MAKCTNCGVEFEGDAEICPTCEIKLNNSQSPSDQDNKQVLQDNIVQRSAVGEKAIAVGRDFKIEHVIIHCALCSSSVKEIETFKCKRCCRILCQTHLDVKSNLCIECTKLQKEEAVEPSAKLVVLSGEDKGQEHVIEQDLTRIGRFGSNDIIIHPKDLSASRHHAEIHRKGDKYIIKDAGSDNGTFVNNDKIKEIELQPGAIIKMGTTEMKFVLGGGDVSCEGDELGAEHTIAIDIMPKATIIMKKGEFQDRSFELDASSGKSSFTIGRREGKDVFTGDDDSTISRDHAEIKVENGQYYLIDIDSKNGTRVNGKKIKQNVKVRLKNGDVIEMGECELEFKC